MTPQYVLKHGIKGWTNRSGNPPAAWDSPEQHRRSAESEIENMNWANAYAEPGYTDPETGILFANWNYFSQRALDILERMGYECEWSDEWSTCEHCNKAVRTSPDSYSYRPSYVILHDCEIVCLDCLMADDDAVREYLETLENNPRHALNNYRIDLAKYGYREVSTGFESGLHSGMTDDPKKITAQLRESGVTTPLLFKIDDTSQFSISFSVWTLNTDDESGDE